MVHKTLTFLCTVAILTQVWSHGAMIWPPQRGITNGFKFAHVQVRDRSAQSDWYAHFPAGDKATWPGAATHSQKQAAGPQGWTPYDPFNPAFKWRANVCGDLNWKNDHMRGGRYYNNGKIHATYNQGEAISVDLAIVAHHNGYIEMFVCDVARCDGEISKDCFRKRACHRLRRSWEPSCESRKDWKCGPMDPRHPSRWYLPCGKSGKPGSGVDIYGYGKIKFQLPSHLTCEHCVVQWYWVSANDCNPPGVVDYYKSDRHPFWGDCPGQGEARGGWRRWETPCGGHRFPEEYYTCADIRIKSKKEQRNHQKNLGQQNKWNTQSKQNKWNEQNIWNQQKKKSQTNKWSQRKDGKRKDMKLSARSRPRRFSKNKRRDWSSSRRQQQRRKKNSSTRQNRRRKRHHTQRKRRRQPKRGRKQKSKQHFSSRNHHQQRMRQARRGNKMSRHHRNRL